MRNLTNKEMGDIKAGDAFMCGLSILGSVGVTLLATTIVAGSAGVGLALIGFGISKAGSIYSIVKSCADI